MKRITLFFILLSVILTGCEEDYDYSANFTAPQTLISPVPVLLDLASTQHVMFSWNGGGASDGGIVLYEVLFDEEDGDFSEPVYRSPSDLGAEPQLTMTHVMLNKMARMAGMKTGETGNLKWKVLASRGGVVKATEGIGTVILTRPAGLEVPEQLYLYGTATENDGQGGLPFRIASDGVFVVYTTLPVDGNVYFAGDETESAMRYFIDENGALQDGESVTAVDKQEMPVRITVNFNTKSMAIDVISGIRMIWGCSYETIAALTYAGNGVFKADNTTIKFVAPDRPDTNPPSWVGWLEERYYFIATVNGTEMCWGRMDGVSGERPSDNEPLSFYELGEFTWSQWDHLWKMSGNLDLKKCTVTVNTNQEGMMVHQFTNVVPL